MPRQKQLEESSVLGTWQIVCCESSDGLHENIKGVEFTLDEGDDVTWVLTPELLAHSQAQQDTFPLLSCQTFELVAKTNSIHFYLSEAGHWIEFKVSFHGEQLVLTSGRNLKLNCNKVTSDRVIQPVPRFSLLDALKEGYFSDLTLSASNGEKFAVHKTVLSCLCPNENWDTIPSFMKDLPADVLRVLLYYLYTGCLMEDQSEDTIRGTLKATEGVEYLRPLVKMCTDFLEATVAICRINTLVNDLEQALDSVKSVLSSLSPPNSTSIVPSQLFVTSKSVAQQVAIALVKFALLCDVFSQRKQELTRKERHKIIESIRDRLPGIVSKLCTLLVICDEVLVQCLLTESKQQEVATYLIPEIEEFWKITSDIGLNAQQTLDNIVEQEDNKHKKKPHSALGSKLSRTFKNAIHLRELKVLKKIQEDATSTFVYVFQKREDFSNMTYNKKITAVIKAIDFLTDEIEGYIPSLENFSKIFESNLKFKAWKTLFKVATARISWFLERVRQNQSSLQSSIDQMCQLVNNESFNTALKELKLLDPAPPGSISAKQGPPVPKQKPEYHTNSGSTSSNHITSDSPLSTVVADLLKTGKYADMTFIVGESTTRESRCHSCNENISRTNDEDILEPLSCLACSDKEKRPGDNDASIDCEVKCEDNKSDTLLKTGQNMVEFKAHRVILAARCHFFKCALLSGMKESIDRTISVPNTNPFLFHIFLESLYLGTMNTDCLSTDQLVEMMTLTDMYEVKSMKDLCEMDLCTHIFDDTVLYLLSMADRYNALQLKNKCLNFMSNPEVYIHSEEFDKLTPELQQEVKKHSIKTEPSTTDKKMESFNGSKLPNLEELTRRHVFEQNSQQGQQETKIDKCIQELTVILGDTIPRRELVRVTLAADCDVNRALNFYFSWQSNDNL